MGLQPGVRLGPYEILAPIGAGGMGEVYRAKDTRLDRTVAIKVMAASLGDRPARQRFEREARAVSRLSHPHICPLFDVGEATLPGVGPDVARPVPFLVMEFLDGETLAARLHKGPLPIDQVLRYAVEIASALDAAHRHGIVHRDLKPGNIMVTKAGATLLDFGLAKAASTRVGPRVSAVGPELPLPTALIPTHEGPLTGEGTILGTFSYMAPEQLEGRDADARSDLFAFGAVVYEMATGRKAFDGVTQASVIAAILDATPPAMSTLQPLTPPALDRVVTICLAKDPDERWQSARDLATEIRWIAEERAAASLSEHAAPAPPVRSAARFATIAAGLAGIGLAAATAIAIYLTRTHDSPQVVAPRVEQAEVAARDGSVADGVVVAPFENRTGDPTFDAYGSIIADRLVQGLTEAGVRAVVASASHALQRGETIAGSYYSQGPMLEVNARIAGAGGRIRYAFEPVNGRAEERERLVADVREKVVGAVAFQSFGYIGLEQLSHAPTYSAWREFLAGMDLFGRDYAGAIRHFERSVELDPAFVWSRMHIVTASDALGNRDHAMRTIAPLIDQRNRLTAYERDIIDWWQALKRGERAQALAFVSDAQTLDPDNFMAGFLVSGASLNLNRPAVALAAFGRLHTDGFIRFGASSWVFAVRSDARHMLGDYAGELRDAQDDERKAPQSIDYRQIEARALVGTGKVAEALRVVDDALVLTAAGGIVMLSSALEFRAHGHRERSVELANRAAAWYRNRASDRDASDATGMALGRALYVAERWDEARQVFERQARQAATTVEIAGRLGALAARRGDRAEANRQSAWLRTLDPAVLQGEQTFWRAKIAALLHDEGAVDLLREAFAQGKGFTVDLHRDIDLEPLRTNEAFRALMAPKG
jgi:tetratricopeptide (TPR) repeat protein